MKFFFFIFICLCANTVFAQSTDVNLNNFIKDANGRYVDLKKSYGVEGSPFFLENYTPAKLTVAGNTYYIKSKLNLVDNNVFFENEGKEMVSSLPVDKVVFFNSKSNEYDLAFRSGFPSVGKNNTQTYYNVIDSGKATYLKHIGVRQRETRPYNSATDVTIYEKEKTYYVFVKGTMHPVKKMDEVVDALADKRSVVEYFISDKKLKFSKEEDVKSLIAYYNKL